MAGGLRSAYVWLGRLSATIAGNSISGGPAETSDTSAGNITFVSSQGAWRSLLGRWAGGYGQAALSPNSISGAIAESPDTSAGTIGLPGVISGAMTEAADTMAGFLFDPHGIIDTGFLFEA